MRQNNRMIERKKMKYVRKHFVNEGEFHTKSHRKQHTTKVGALIEFYRLMYDIDVVQTFNCSERRRIQFSHGSSTCLKIHLLIVIFKENEPKNALRNEGILE